VDQLDLSSAITGVNRLGGTSQIAGSGEIRIDRVAEIRRQIADGSYETPEKLDAALERLLDQFA
jgi:anti-sigma28 factor (negative regulator of flagellin synthesis)